MSTCFRHIFFCCFLALAVVFQPGTLLARQATIADIIVTNSETELLLYFTVKNCFTDEITAGIQNGIPATFTFYVDLYQVRKGWPDKKLASHNFNHTLAYDNPKEEYRITLAEKKQENTVVSNLARAQSLMAEVNGFSAIPLSRLESDRTYRLKVKAKLAKKTLPMYFHYLIPFSSLWDFDTDWHVLEFRY
ncbi:MAG: hypothetical protein A2521_00990 [Deltaproteobacteria bacterium RIFOXYD12_FULL_57_12]|nr:MAG: hypothetical protein A2521_00990 [Deltaproteobacteria bacterium RIFOXYD12_FULL_57_12]